MDDHGGVTIHSEHPFVPPVDLRDPIRRLRGRLPAPVTVWASAESRPSGTRATDGWTVSSLLVGEGQPGAVVALLDEDSDYWDMLERVRTATINVLGPGQGQVADAFARTMPSPGGPFRTGEWDQDTDPYGPRLVGASAWVGVRLVEEEPMHAGWGVLVRATIETLELAEAVEALGHLHGRYVEP